MQVIYTTNTIVSDHLRLTEKELVMLSEIGFNQIPTATAFVEYISGAYALSTSGVWYTLKKLKKEGLIDFTEKGEEYSPLCLTEVGVHVLRKSTMLANAERQQAVKQHVVSLRI